MQGHHNKQRFPSEKGFQLINVTKAFGPTRALDDISLNGRPGSVLSLFGLNGAGKSTLINILAGVIRPDSGQVITGGTIFAKSSPIAAIRAGMIEVPQELTVWPSLSVAENVVIGRWPGKNGLVSREAISDRFHSLCEIMGIDPPLGDGAADRQLITILRALNMNPTTLLLDEPTAALTEDESRLVLRMVRQAASHGTTVVLVTHKLAEAASVADEAAVLRNGRLVLTGPWRSFKQTDIVEAMVGPEAKLYGRAATRRTLDNKGSREVLTRLRGISTSHPEPLYDINLTLHAGEIIGVYGIRGSGVNALANVLGGTLRPTAGVIQICEKEYRKGFKSPRKRSDANIGFVPGDRKLGGLSMSHSIATNILFPPGADNKGPIMGLIRAKGAESDFVETLLDRLDVQPRIPELPVSALSGGNQQKVLVASRLRSAYRVVILHEPTRGVDISARARIHEAIVDLKNDQRSAIVLSSEPEELIDIADRVVILVRGAVVMQLSKSEINMRSLITAAAGDLPDNERSEGGVLQ